MLKRERTIDEIQLWQSRREAKAEAIARVPRISLTERSAMTRSQDAPQPRRDLAIPRVPNTSTKFRSRQRPVAMPGKRRESPRGIPLAPLPAITES
jgi:hypothetical protein